jgi:hypothetical protein
MQIESDGALIAREIREYLRGALGRARQRLEATGEGVLKYRVSFAPHLPLVEVRFKVTVEPSDCPFWIDASVVRNVCQNWRLSRDLGEPGMGALSLCNGRSFGVLADAVDAVAEEMLLAFRLARRPEPEAADELFDRLMEVPDTMDDFLGK